MANCIRCGGPLGDFDAGGDMICQNCESARFSQGSSIGGAGNAPCQRCGMYLPRHELRMHNSRLYCAYCIMDIQDEEKYGRERGRGSAGSESGRTGGSCERCGRETDILYSVQGRRLCSACYAEGSAGGAAPGAPPMLSLIFERVLSAFGVRQKPKIIPVPPEGKIGIKAPKDEEAEKARLEKAMRGFDLKERRMMREEEGQLGINEPISEGHRKERKPAPKAKKKFFSWHSEKEK